LKARTETNIDGVILQVLEFFLEVMGGAIRETCRAVVSDLHPADRHFGSVTFLAEARKSQEDNRVGMDDGCRAKRRNAGVCDGN
jgi:hypothetical protein